MMENENALTEARRLLDFLHASPTAFHAVETARRTLEGFEPLRECEPWQLEPGHRYLVTRNRSSLIAFTMPAESLRSFRLIAAHSDSPTFRIKENAELVLRDQYVRLNTERYGGQILSTWFDRPLSVAGRLLIRTDAGLSTRLIDLDRDICVIPNLAIHMNRTVNDGVKLNPAVDTLPLWGSSAAAGTFRKTIAEAAGVKQEDILGSDLYLYNRMPGCIWGVRQEYLSAPRLDDLECVYGGVRALQQAAPAANHADVLAVFDNEEVGSTTRQGADSGFLQDVLTRIADAAGADIHCLLAGSLMLSADNAHAVHPNHPELSDQHNAPLMNGGIVIKHSANQKYTTDGASEAVFRSVCHDAGVPLQTFANRSDLAGGSTLGNLSARHVSVSTLDIGLAQLAMHSSWETAGALDPALLVRGMTAWFDAAITVSGDGEMRFA